MWARPSLAISIQPYVRPVLRLAVTALLAGWLAAGPGASAWSCETPVYRYAMYRWQPTPYEVYSFHDASNADAHKGVEKALGELSTGTEHRANVVFIPVNLSDDPELNSVTPDIKQAWESQQDPTLPSYLISTPYGVQIFAGTMDVETVKALAESPARKRMAQLLEAGKIGVLMMLTGEDKDQNAKTRAILTGLVDEVAAGKIPLYTTPDTGLPGTSAAASAPAGESANADEGFADGAAYDEAVAPELGFIEVDRNDEKEVWLVRQLLAMESDLPEETRPMVFLTYGRGRALLPYIGAGITRENLIREVEFISGACSCTVKEQNPGVDLLVRYDWEAAAAALADRFGTEEGNESQFGPADFLPELIIPSSTPAAANVVAETGPAEPGSTSGEAVALAAREPANKATELAGGEAASEDAAVDGPSAAAGEVDRRSEASETVAADGAATETSDEVALVSDSSTAPATGETAQLGSQRTYFSMAIVGGGLALGLVVLFGLTFFVMRPH